MEPIVLVRDRRNNMLYEHRVITKHTPKGSFRAYEIRLRRGRTTDTQSDWQYIKSIEFKQNFFDVLSRSQRWWTGKW